MGLKITFKAQAPSMGQLTTAEIVVVKVGQAGIVHRIHQPLLVHHSGYFRGALTGPWKEAEDKVITLGDVDPRIFAIFSDWLYTQTLPINADMRNRASFPQEAEKSDQEQLRTYIEAYLLGDRFLAPGFRRAANEAFKTITENCTSFTQTGREIIEFAFTTPVLVDRVMLQCLVHRFCQTWDDENQDDYGTEVTEKMPAAFLDGVARRFREMSKSNANAGKAVAKTSKRMQPCFLEHESEEEKGKCWALHMMWDEKRKVGYSE